MPSIAYHTEQGSNNPGGGTQSNRNQTEGIKSGLNKRIED